MPGPLESLKILDFSTLLPGPFASLMLADMGAEVLRVESPERMDLVRMLPPHVNGVSTSHAYLNRNKGSIGLNLKAREAQAIVRGLIAEYDIVIEQFRPGVMDKLGVGYEALKAINPRLIYVSITGYGQTGPYRDRAGHDINYLALSGLASYTGRRDDGPVPPGMQVADVAGGSLHAVAGLLAAVVHRERTGEGQHVDISMTDCVFSLNAMAGAACLAAEVEPELEGTMLNGGSFYDYYRTRDGRWMAVGSLEPQFLKALCETLGRPELAATGLSASKSDQQKLKAELTTAFLQHDFSHWCEQFAGVDACVEPVLSLKEAARHPQLVARGVVQQVPVGDVMQLQMACPIVFGSGVSIPRHGGKALGEDSERILLGMGLTPEEIAALRAARAVG
ncbi:CaiB/BaiF CoA transferase family protein [Halopseudomonas laoshanensis]|uniref:CaiB/BaiF CoA transferase family protein n=1 Tax=Halopseudomonas laoshanensis TaxID=2268758 RepID=UPI0037353A24